MSLTIGIDPGSRITGYGILEPRGREIAFVASGIIKAGSSGALPERLRRIKEGLDEVLVRYRPSSLAVEEVFFAKNPKSALALGEARGVVLLAAAEAEIPVFEYSTREVKGSVVGSGAAHKSQVAAMIGRLVRMDHEPASEDETDALAVAFCHVLRASGPAGRITC